MAFISKQDEEQESGINTLGQNSGESATIAPEVPQAQTQPVQVNQSQPKPTTSGFVNLKKYTKANAPAAEKMSTDIAGKLQGTASNIGQQLQQKQEAYKQQLAANQAKAQEAKSYGEKLVANAGATSVSDDDAKKFQDIVSGTTQFSNLPDYNVQAQKSALSNLQQQIAGAGTTSGRQQLLKQTYGTPGTQYSTGQQNLDRLLLGASAPARQALASSVQGIDKPITESELAGSKEVSSGLENLKQQEKALRDALQNQLGTATTGTEGDIIKSLESAKSQETTAQTNLQKLYDLYAKGNVDVNEVNNALKESSTQKLLNVSDLAKIQSMNEAINKADSGISIADILKNAIKVKEGTGATRANAISAELQARANALAKLRGESGEFGTDNSKFAATSYGYDLDAAQKELADRLKAMTGQNVDYSDESENLRRLLAPTSSELGEDISANLGDLASFQKMPAEQRAAAIAKLAATPTRNTLGQAYETGTTGVQAANEALSGDPSLAIDKFTPVGQNVDTAKTGINSLQNLLSGNISEGGANLAQLALLKAPIIKDVGGKQVGSVIAKAQAAAKKLADRAKDKIQKMFSDERVKENIRPADNNIERLLDLIGRKNEKN